MASSVDTIRSMVTSKILRTPENIRTDPSCMGRRKMCTDNEKSRWFRRDSCQKATAADQSRSEKLKILREQKKRMI